MACDNEVETIPDISSCSGNGKLIIIIARDGTVYIVQTVEYIMIPVVIVLLVAMLAYSVDCHAITVREIILATIKVIPVLDYPPS